MLALTYSPSCHMFQLHMAEVMLGYPKDTRSARWGQSRDTCTPSPSLLVPPRGTPALLSSSMHARFSLSLSSLFLDLIYSTTCHHGDMFFDFTHPPFPGMFLLDPYMGSGTASGTPLESLVVHHIPFMDVTSCKLPDLLGHQLCNSFLCLSFTC